MGGAGMKAWVLGGIGDIRLQMVPRPVPAEGEVLVEVRAAGICGSDIPRIYRTGAHRHPLILGHEFSGEVAGLGPGADPGWLGARVGVFPLIPCGECGPCRKGQYELCRHYDFLGSRRDGGFAEYVAVPVRSLIRLPEDVSFEEAVLLEPMAVAVHAMRRIQRPGEDTAAIFGLGTVGLMLLLLLLEAERVAGERPAGEGIFAIGNKESQRQRAMEMGLPPSSYCDSRRQDCVGWLMERTGGRGADAVFECVGKNETYAQAVDSAACEGRICLVGNPASDMGLERETYWKILRRQLTVTGAWNSSFTRGPEDDWHYALERLFGERAAVERLISHRLPMEELEKGFHIMRDKSEDYVKIMGVWQQGGAG